METFWDFFWFMVVTFIWVAWIMLLFRVFIDIFRSNSSGWAKAGWSLFVIFAPFLGVLVYLIAQGGNMAQRDVEQAQAMDQAQRDYIRSVTDSGGGTAAELEKLAELKSKGVITEEEFQAQKAKLLA
ncbi:MAG TPA: SHOCT domain-containing protein [Acidimicrobiia bacterium]|nr:SHOCT domain-containing protein [Acidimicrobiia bacterium]